MERNLFDLVEGKSFTILNGPLLEKHPTVQLPRWGIFHPEREDDSPFISRQPAVSSAIHEVVEIYRRHVCRDPHHRDVPKPSSPHLGDWLCQRNHFYEMPAFQETISLGGYHTRADYPYNQFDDLLMRLAELSALVLKEEKLPLVGPAGPAFTLEVCANHLIKFELPSIRSAPEDRYPTFLEIRGSKKSYQESAEEVLTDLERWTGELLLAESRIARLEVLKDKFRRKFRRDPEFEKRRGDGAIILHWVTWEVSRVRQTVGRSEVEALALALSGVFHCTGRAGCAGLEDHPGNHIPATDQIRWDWEKETAKAKQPA